MTAIAAPVVAGPRGRFDVCDRLRTGWHVVLGERLDEGRIRLGGLHPGVRYLTVLGLAGVIALLFSLLFGNHWRQGPLVLTNTDQAGRSTFVPLNLFPVTLLGLAVAWLLLFVGSAFAAARIKLFVAIAFLVVNSPIGSPVVVTVSRAWILQHGSRLALICYFAAPVALVISALPWRRMTSLDRTAALLGRIALTVAVVASAGLFGTLLAMQVVGRDAGLGADLPYLLDGGILQLQNLLLPLVFLSQLAIIKFCYGMGSLVADSARRTSRTVPARIGLLVLIAVKLSLQVGQHLQSWRDYLGHRQDTVIRTAVAMAALGLAALLFRRFHDRPTEVGTEKVSILASVALALPLLLILVTGALNFLLAVELPQATLRRYLLDAFPSVPIVEKGPVVVFVLLFALGCWRLLWAEGVAARHSSVGLLIVAAWAISCTGFDAANYQPGFRLVLADILVTVAVLIYAAACWSRLDVERSAQLAGFVVFIWLVGQKGGFLTLVGRLIGLKEVIVVVVGVLLALLTESAFTGGRSRLFPRPARPLLWVGYFVLSLAITNWIQVTHGFDLNGTAIGRGITYVGVPVAAWLAMSRRFRPATGVEEVEAPTSDLYSVG